MHHINLISIGLVALGMSAASLQAQGNQEAANLTKQGIEASKANDWDKAVNDFRRASQLDARYAPNLVAALRHRAVTYREQQKFPEAAADLSEALKIKSDDADIFEQRGYIEMQMKDYDKALADYSQAIKLSPNESKYYQVRAYIYQTKNDFQHALDDVNKVLQIDPQNSDAETRKHFLEAKLHPHATPPPLPSGPIANPKAPRPSDTATPATEIQPMPSQVKPAPSPSK